MEVRFEPEQLRLVRVIRVSGIEVIFGDSQGCLEWK